MNADEYRSRLASYDDVDLQGPIDAAQVEEAEESLKCQLPPEYRSFLLACGCGGIGPEDFIGLGGPDHLNVVKLTSTLRNRQNALPKNLLPLRGDGFGNYDCIDLSKPTNNGECYIVQWNHEGGVPEVLASSFDEWFESMLVLINEIS